MLTKCLMATAATGLKDLGEGLHDKTLARLIVFSIVFK